MSLENTLQNRKLPPQQNQQKLAQDRLKESITYLHSSSLAIRCAYTAVFIMYCSLFIVCLKPANAGFRQVFGSALSLIRLLFTQMAGLQGPHELRRARPGLLTLANFALGIGA